MFSPQNEAPGPLPALRSDPPALTLTLQPLFSSQSPPWLRELTSLLLLLLTVLISGRGHPCPRQSPNTTQHNTHTHTQWHRPAFFCCSGVCRERPLSTPPLRLHFSPACLPRPIPGLARGLASSHFRLKLPRSQIITESSTMIEPGDRNGSPRHT